MAPSKGPAELKEVPQPAQPPATLEDMAKQGALVAIPAATLLQAINSALDVEGLPQGTSVRQWTGFWQGQVPSQCQPVKVQQTESSTEEQ